MNGEETNLPPTSPEPIAGEGSFERSENEPSPAAPAAGPGSASDATPTPENPAGLNPNLSWEEDPWPKPQPTDEGIQPSDATDGHSPTPNLGARRRGAYAKPVARPVMPMSPQQRLLLLDTWQRSGLPARDFGALVNISRHTLYAWKRRSGEDHPVSFAADAERLSVEFGASGRRASWVHHAGPTPARQPPPAPSKS